MVKGKRTHIRLSDIPPDVWMDVVLVRPSEFGSMVIPRAGAFLMYKAYFPFEEKRRLFNLVVPESRWREAIKAVPPQQRDNLEVPVLISLKRSKRYELSIRKWQQLNSSHTK